MACGCLCLARIGLADAFADVFAAALHKRRAGQRAKEKQGKARHGKAQPRHAMYIHTHTHTHTHTLYNSVLQPYALGLGQCPVAGILWPWPWKPVAKIFRILCILLLTRPDTVL